MKTLHNKKILTFYTKKQVCFEGIKTRSYSQSPLKPYLLMKKIKKGQYSDMLEITEDFKPYTKEDFLIAHTKKYVNNMFKGKGNCNSNGIPWSENLVESLTYTNAALHNAVRYSFTHPEQVTFAPVSGMHHARPNYGSGFCTFSGQVISAIKMYEEFGAVGAYFDLDGHYGNSIEDARAFNPKINHAIPVGNNVNIRGITGDDYVEMMYNELSRIGYGIFTGKIHYVVFAHGCDSHIDDDLSAGVCDTQHWLKCSTLFAEWVKEIELFTCKPLPITLALFGGYRKDNYNAVLDLHTKSLLQISNIVCGNEYKDTLIIPNKHKPEFLDSAYSYFENKVEGDVDIENFEEQVRTFHHKKPNRNGSDRLKGGREWKTSYLDYKRNQRIKLFGTDD